MSRDDDVRIGRIGVAALVLGAVVVLAVTAVLLVLRAVGMSGHDEREESMSMSTLVRAPKPAGFIDGPLQESAPQPALRDYLRGKQQYLESSGWIDRARGRAHIPIETAMSMLSGPGTPSTTAKESSSPTATSASASASASASPSASPPPSSRPFSTSKGKSTP